jgi:hypothetical protein
MNRISIILLYVSLVPVLVSAQGFIIGPDWAPNNLPIGIESRTFSVAISPAPSTTITLTPNVSGLVFNPAQLTFNATTLVQSFSFHGITQGSPSITWTVTGGAYTPPFPRTVSIVPRNFYLQAYASNLVVGQNATVFSISTPYPPPTGVTVAILYDPTQAAVAVQPQYLNFYPSTNDGIYVTAFSNIPATTHVNFGIGGPDANLYSLAFGSFFMAFNFKNIFVPSSMNLVAGSPQNFTLTLDYPPTTSVTVIPYGSGLTFVPSNITISAPATSASFQVYTNTVQSTTITYYVVGPDAGQYNVGTTSVNVVFATISISLGDLSALVVGVNSTFTIFVSQPQIGGVTVTPQGNGLTFTPSSVTFSGACVSATMSVVASIPGPQQVYFALSGPNAASFELPFVTASANVLQRTFSVSPVPVLIAGVPSPEITIASVAPAPLSSIIPPISTVQVTPCSIPSGLITFDPPALTFTNPTSVLSFTMTANLISSGFTPPQVSFEISGPDAVFYTSPPSISVSIVRNTFNTPTNYINTLVFPNSNQFPVGFESNTFGVTAVGVQSSVTLTPVSNLVTFDPPILYFTAAENTVFFTITGVTTGIGPITYVVGGNDAYLFAVPPPSNPIQVVNLYNIPDIPSLPVNVTSPPLTISVQNSNPSTVFITPTANNVIFDPPTFLLSSAVTSAQFTVRGLATTVVTANPNIPGEQYLNNLLFGALASSNVVTWNVQEMSGSSYQLSVPNYRSSVTILPGYFNISIPTLRLGVTSVMNVTISTPPRSNVVLTFLGNNLLFEPASITFLPHSQTTISLQVTPQIQNNADWNIPFKIDYLCSGGASLDYICPAESFVAVQRRSGAVFQRINYVVLFIATTFLLLL